MEEFLRADFSPLKQIEDIDVTQKFQEKMRILSDLMGAMGVSIIDVMGETAAVGIMSRACKASGLVNGQNLLESLNVSERNLLAAMKILKVNGGFFQSTSTLVELTTHRAIVHVSFCPLVGLQKHFGKDAELLICEICRNYNEGVLHAVCPECQFTVLKRLSAGDPYCEFVRTSNKKYPPKPATTKRNTLGYPLDDVFIPNEFRRQNLSNFYTGFIARMTEAVVAVIDIRPTQGIAGRAWETIGKTEGAKIRRTYAKKGTRIKDALLPPLAVFETFGVPYGYIHGTDDEASWHGFDCLFGKAFRDMHNEDEESTSFLCAMCNRFLQGLVKAAGPSYVLDAPKRLPMGYSYCEFRIRAATPTVTAASEKKASKGAAPKRKAPAKAVKPVAKKPVKKTVKKSKKRA